MAVVELIFDVKTPSFLIGNTDVPKAGEPVFLTDGRYCFGDNVTQFQNLVFFGNTTSLTDGKQTFLNADGNPVTIPHVPVFVYSVFAGPGYLNEGIDYTISGATFTFLSPSFIVGLTVTITYKYNGSQAPTPSPVGNLMTNDFASGNWDVAKHIDGSVVFTGTTIQFTGATSGSDDNYIRYKQIYSASEKVKFSMSYIAHTVGGANYGPGWTVIQNNPYQTSSIINIIFYMSTATMGQTIYLARNASGGEVDGPYSGGGFTVTAGDLIRQDLTVDGNVYTIQGYQNGVLKVTQVFTLDFTYPGSTGVNIEEWNICITNYGGSDEITAISIDSLEYKNIDLAVVGDSKPKGFWNGTYANTIVGLLRANNPGKYIQKYAGTTAVTATVLLRIYEIIRAQPKNILLYVGRNDEQLGIAAATTQANYSSIVSQLLAGIPGVNIVHQLPTPEDTNKPGTTNAPNHTAWLLATYPTACILVPGTYNAITDNDPEGVHSITSGALKIYNNIVASGLLTL